MVTIFCPATDSAEVRQERVALPRTKTVQAPHWPSPQPYLVPVRPNRLRRTDSKDSPDAHSALCSAPLTIRLIDCMLDTVDSNFPPDYSTSGALPGTSRGTRSSNAVHQERITQIALTPTTVPVLSEGDLVADLTCALTTKRLLADPELFRIRKISFSSVVKVCVFHLGTNHGNRILSLRFFPPFISSRQAMR